MFQKPLDYNRYLSSNFLSLNFLSGPLFTNFIAATAFNDHGLERFGRIGLADQATCDSAIGQVLGQDTRVIAVQYGRTVDVHAAAIL